jgi:hypothetical protein
MAKPIFIIEIPFTTTEDQLRDYESFGTQWDDYHILLIEKDIDEITYKVIYEKDFTEINFEELKELVKEATNV